MTQLILICLQPPVAAEPWEGVLHATKDGSICSQRDPFRRDVDIVGSEDCLYLNVYTPHWVNSFLFSLEF